MKYSMDLANYCSNQLVTCAAQGYGLNVQYVCAHDPEMTSYHLDRFQTSAAMQAY